MNDGELDKKRYRTFNVRGDAVRDQAGQINDDYGAMYEVLARRFRAGRSGRGPSVAASARRRAPDGGRRGRRRRRATASGTAPDLFVVDGGRGQLAVALAAAHDLGLHELPIVGAREGARRTSPGGRGGRRSEGPEKLVDRVYLPGQKNPIPLKSTTTSLFLLARLRDEAHRFSNRARMRLGKRGASTRPSTT